MDPPRSRGGRPKRVLFLDVDGVLNTHHEGRSLTRRRRNHESSASAIQSDIHPENLVRMTRAIRDANCVVVLSSAWRLLDEHKRIITSNLRSDGVEVISSTGIVPCGCLTADGKVITTGEKARCVEIMQWLRNNGPIESWVAVDDMDLWTAGGPTFKGHFVHTKPHFGFTDGDAELMVRLFGGASKKRRSSGTKALGATKLPLLNTSQTFPEASGNLKPEKIGRGGTVFAPAELTLASTQGELVQRRRSFFGLFF